MTFRNFLLLFFASGIYFLTSCDNKRVFESYSPVPASGWQKDSIFSCTVAINDSTQNYNLFINIRNSVDYSYSNIWLILTIISPDETIRTETLEFVLADNTGKWFGAGHGKLRDNKLLYRRNVYFPKNGNYILKIQHGMRNDDLEGISDVGIRVETTK